MKARIGQKGITLIELMIVVAIVAILASVAYPSYQEQVRQSRRADAQTALLELAQFMERFYTTNGTYVGAALPFNEAPKDGNAKHYDLNFNGAVAANAYTLQAVPKGAMAGDACGTMRITNTGVKTRTGALAESRCWRN